MFRPMIRGVGLAGAAAVAGCVAPQPVVVGHDFPQAAFAGFVLDRTSAADVEAALGLPTKTSSMSGLAKPDSKIVAPGTRFTVTTLRYLFAPAGVGLPLSRHPLKLASVVFFDGRLTAYDVNSFIPGESNLVVDEARLAELRQGQTTAAQAVALLGPPNGEALHMEASAAGASELGYNWLQGEGLLSKRRVLRVFFDRSGRLVSYVVTDAGFAGAPQPIPGAPPPVPREAIPPADLSHT